MARIAAALALFLLTAACAPTAQQAQQHDPGLQPQYGGVLQIASIPIPVGLYWFDQVAAGGGGHRASLTPAFETLVSYVFEKQGDDFQSKGAAGQLTSGLAESWKIVDPKTFDFTLRKGVKWHDGETFSAKDVVWSIQQWKQNIAPRDLRTVGQNIEKAEVQGDGVRLVLKNIDPDFLQQLADYNPKILPAHIAEKNGNPTGQALQELYNKSAVGTGPLKLRSFDKNRHMELERFDDYWGGKPYLDGLRVIYRIERQAQQAAFIAGELDFINLADKVQYDTVKGAVPGAQKIAYVATHATGIEFNVRRKPWDDVRVRRAIHLGMDRQALHAAGSFGEGYIGAPLLVPSFTMAGWGLSQDEYLKMPGWRQPKEQDVAEAKRLLREAGIQEGYQTQLKWRKGSTQPTVFAEPAASQMKTIGLNVTAPSYEDATYIQMTEQDKDYDMRIESSVGGSLTPGEAAYTKFHSKSVGNTQGISDPELDRLIEAVQVEIDPKKRSELFTQMQRRVIDQAYFISLPTISLFQSLQPWLHEWFGSFSANASVFNSHKTWMEVDKISEARRKF